MSVKDAFFCLGEDFRRRFLIPLAVVESFGRIMIKQKRNTTDKQFENRIFYLCKHKNSLEAMPVFEHDDREHNNIELTISDSGRNFQGNPKGYVNLELLSDADFRSASIEAPIPWCHFASPCL